MPSKKTSQKTLRKLVLEAIWGSKTPPKSKKNLQKSFWKRCFEKNSQKRAFQTQKKTCLSKEREARTFLKVVEACNCEGLKFPTRGNKTSSSRSTQSSSSKQRKAPDSSRAVHAQWAMETQRKHQRASLARFARPRPNTILKSAQKLPRSSQNPPKSIPRPRQNP